MTRRVVSSLTRSLVPGFSARDAVAGCTPAAEATSRKVAGRSWWAIALPIYLSPGSPTGAVAGPNVSTKHPIGHTLPSLSLIGGRPSLAGGEPYPAVRLEDETSARSEI